MAESRTRRPARKAKAQADEIKLEFVVELGMYKFVATHGASVPDELDGLFTNPRVAEKTYNRVFG